MTDERIGASARASRVVDDESTRARSRRVDPFVRGSGRASAFPVDVNVVCNEHILLSPYTMFEL